MMQAGDGAVSKGGDYSGELAATLLTVNRLTSLLADG